MLDVQEAMEPRRSSAPRGVSRQHPGAHRHPQGRLSRGHPRSRASSRWRAGTTPPRCSTATLRTTAASPMMESGRVVVVTSTQIPHIVRRVVGQALGMPWGEGPGHQALYRRRLRQQAGRAVRAPVRLVLHPGGRPSGAAWSAPGRRPSSPTGSATPSGPTSSPGSGRTAPWPPGSLRPSPTRGPTPPTATASWPRAWAPSPSSIPATTWSATAWTVFTNRPAAGAMRGYGMPQAMLCRRVPTSTTCCQGRGHGPPGLPDARIIMPQWAMTDGFSQQRQLYDDSFRQCLEARAWKYIDYDRKLAEFAKDQTGPIRRGIGVAAFWYNTAVYPISLETSSNRMAAEPGRHRHQCSAARRRSARAADTAYAQMAADVVGLGDYRRGPRGVLPGYGHHPHRPGRLRLPPDVCGRASPSARRACC